MKSIISNLQAEISGTKAKVSEATGKIIGKVSEETEKIRADKVLTGRIYLITLATALLILAVAVKGPEERGRVISSDDGRAVGIERHTSDSVENYDFEVEIYEGKDVITREVNLTLQAVRNEKNPAGLTDEISREAEIDSGLDSLVNELEYSKGRRIALPSALRDGTPISWTAVSKEDYSIFFLIPLIYIALLVFVIRSGSSSEKEKESKNRQSILRGLPRFCNQLYLMMNAGMILSDAFERITDSYASKESSTYFERELAAKYMKDPEHRESTAKIINEFAVENDVKEMIRIATILTENEKRGSDVIESLSRESRYLWDERKIVARESGKMIDTKMAYPLGILLILLIVITMAPAMLSM